MRTSEDIKQYHRERRAALKAAGVCPRCGREDAAPGRAHCAACLADWLERMRAKNQEATCE